MTAAQLTSLAYAEQFVPEDETCFVLCEAASAEAVRETVRRAALTFERIAEAVAPSESQEVQLCP